MNNTAFGSRRSRCPASSFHLFLTAYAKKMVETVELNALKLENLLSRRQAGETSAMDFETVGLSRATLTEGQRHMAFYFSQAQAQARRQEEGGELNIVPYLDILMNLIMFMLLSITGLAAFGILNVNAPNYGGPTDAGHRRGRQAEAAPHRAHLQEGLLRRRDRAACWASSRRSPTPPRRRPTIPKKADGTLRLRRAHRDDGER